MEPAASGDAENGAGRSDHLARRRAALRATSVGVEVDRRRPAACPGHGPAFTRALRGAGLWRAGAVVRIDRVGAGVRAVGRRRQRRAHALVEGIGSLPVRRRSRHARCSASLGSSRRRIRPSRISEADLVGGHFTGVAGGSFGGGVVPRARRREAPRAVIHQQLARIRGEQEDGRRADPHHENPIPETRNELRAFAPSGGAALALDVKSR